MGKEKCNEGRRNGRTWTRTTWRRIKLLIKVASGEFTGCVSRGMGINKPRFQRNSSYFVLDSFLLRNNVMAGLLGVSKTRQLSLPNALLLRSNNVSSLSLSLSLSLPCHLTKQFRQMEHRQSMLASFPFFSFCDTNLCRVEDRGFYPSASASVSVARVEVLGNLWSWGNKDRPDWLGRISGYLAKRAMKNFAAGRNDNRFIYSVSPKTREREDWTLHRRQEQI